MKKAYYSVGDDDTIYEIESDCEDDFLAQECADDYYSNHDGYEDSWPIVVNLHDDNGYKLKSFEVTLEHEPTFYAIEKKEG